MENSKTINARIKEHYRALLEDWEGQGRSQTELAKKIGVTPAQISHLKKDEKEFTLDRLQTIADGMNTPVEYFFLADPRLPVAENKKLCEDILKCRKGLVWSMLMGEK